MIFVLQIIGIAFMITLMFVGVWGFITLNQIFGQLRYQNYLLEKLTQNIYMMATKKNSSPIDNPKNT
jgi:hypothetical protein